ncbi:hypothetical protein LTR08_003279 [Meristemomyces frigidus]|nr:hypothetical protein LTR08_003279 [Meristemomyces frigidus]
MPASIPVPVADSPSVRERELSAVPVDAEAALSVDASKGNTYVPELPVIVVVPVSAVDGRLALPEDWVADAPLPDDEPAMRDSVMTGMGRTSVPAVAFAVWDAEPKLVDSGRTGTGLR